MCVAQKKAELLDRPFEPTDCYLTQQPRCNPGNRLALTVFGLTPWREGQLDMGAAAAIASLVGECSGSILLDHLERIGALGRELRTLVDEKPAPVVAPPPSSERAVLGAGGQAA